jgi:predicted ATP-dependent serine protease
MFELIIITMLHNGLPMVNTTSMRFTSEAECRKAGSMLAVHLPVPRPQVRCVHRSKPAA